MSDAASRLITYAEDWIDCQRCEIAGQREGPVIFGNGNAPADYLFVSTMPSEEDEEFNLAFQDTRGELVLQIMKEAGIPHQEVFFTYLLGCRPKMVIPATEEEQERIETRKPAKEEVQACTPRLLEIVYQVDPRVIVTFGLLPLQVLAHNGTRIRKLSGKTKQVYEAHIPGRIETLRYPIISSIDSDMLLKNPSAAKHGPFATTMDVLIRARQFVTWTKKQEGITDV